MIISATASSGLEGKFQAVCASPEDANTLSQLMTAGLALQEISSQQRQSRPGSTSRSNQRHSIRRSPADSHERDRRSDDRLNPQKHLRLQNVTSECGSLASRFAIKDLSEDKREQRVSRVTKHASLTFLRRRRQLLNQRHPRRIFQKLALHLIHACKRRLLLPFRAVFSRERQFDLDSVGQPLQRNIATLGRTVAMKTKFARRHDTRLQR